MWLLKTSNLHLKRFPLLNNILAIIIVIIIFIMINIFIITIIRF